jgi:hypothetical protein
MPDTTSPYHTIRWGAQLRYLCTMPHCGYTTPSRRSIAQHCAQPHGGVLRAIPPVVPPSAVAGPAQAVLHAVRREET